MPIKVPSNLPAKKILEDENVFMMDEHRALHQDIHQRPVICVPPGLAIND